MARTTGKTKSASTKKAAVKSNRFTKTPASRTTPKALSRAQQGLQYNQSVISIILGVLILIVLGFSLFNFFKNQNGQLIPAQSTTNKQRTGEKQAVADVDKDHLPGKYTVKQGDTLFLIAQKYYGDGYQYQKLAQANHIADENTISVGQVLDIPNLTTNIAQAQPTTPPSMAPSTSPSPSATPALSQGNTQFVQGGTGGSPDETEWGPKITGTTYTVQEGDWLSKIAGRAYGDIYQYQKLAQVNHISNPDLIEPGTVLQIPR